MLGKILMGGKMLFGFLTAFFTAIAAHIFGGKANAKPLPPGNPPAPPTPPAPVPVPAPAPANLPEAPKTTAYTYESWRPFIIPLLPRGMPEQFVKNYGEKESGWNPCAIGAVGVKGPDGFPREQGIAQLYNPDDLKLLGIKAGQFRKYCNPGGTTRAEQQFCLRPLTSVEMNEQVKSLIAKIKSMIPIANRVLLASGAARLPGWAPTTEDFWRLVKLVHGLPGLANGMAFVTKKLGRAPSDWKEFRDQVMAGVKMDSGTERYRFKYGEIFDNAEFTASGSGAAVV